MHDGMIQVARLQGCEPSFAVREEAFAMQYLRGKFRNPFLRLALFLTLAVLATYSFLQYVSWSATYSGVLGLTSQLEHAKTANQRAWFFLCLCGIVEVLLTVLVGSSSDSPEYDSGALRFAARYGLGLLLSILVTAVLVALGLNLSLL